MITNRAAQRNYMGNPFGEKFRQARIMELICQTKNLFACDLVEFDIDCDLNDSEEQHLMDCTDVAWMHFSQLSSGF